MLSTPPEKRLMKVAVACDHGGYPLKSDVIQTLQGLGHTVLDLGAHQYEATDDYPDYARYVAQAIQHGHAQRGVLICGSGVGACIAANKYRGVRAGICHDTYSAHQGVEHDDMNVLCLGARIIGSLVADEIVTAFANASFSGEERHQRRLDKVNGIEDSL